MALFRGAISSGREGRFGKEGMRGLGLFNGILWKVLEFWLPVRQLMSQKTARSALCPYNLA